MRKEGEKSKARNRKEKAEKEVRNEEEGEDIKRTEEMSFDSEWPLVSTKRNEALLLG